MPEIPRPNEIHCVLSSATYKAGAVGGYTSVKLTNEPLQIYAGRALKSEEHLDSGKHIAQCLRRIVDFRSKMSAISNHRIKTDVMKLIEKKHDVTMCDDYRNLLVKFYGPEDTPYKGGVWNVRVFLPENYPFKSPSVGFATQIFHPNVHQTTGTICLDALNEKWTALYDLVIIFETLLPQLLRNPNPEDPLNQCAALVLRSTPGRYKHVVAKHVKEHASPERMLDEEKDNSEHDSNVSDLSD